MLNILYKFIFLFGNHTLNKHLNKIQELERNKLE